MDNEDYINLIKARMSEAEEFLEDAKSLLSLERYKSANNRAYYSMEKSVGSLLAYKHISYRSHNGIIHQFNAVVNDDQTPFDGGDYKMFARTETIRSHSDYDDFYIANKEQTRQVVENAEYLYKKTMDYLQGQLGISILGEYEKTV